jgi:isoleucyl-tRNA synthetase
MATDKVKKEVVSKSAIALREEEILAFWDKNKIFEKSLQKDAPKGEFTFYDGPPFATGLPHYGHILAGTMKDVIPRFKTMQGYHVTRRWGWDCHGLPIENLIEKELGLKSKKDIEEYGIEKFNKAARESVLRYYADWRRIVPRLGRWVDMDNYYMTMDSTYTESVWWSFKELFNKKLAYEGYKSMHLCPHCGTTLSNFEVNQGYKDITDISVYVEFQLRDEKGKDVPNTYLLAWTTTPWTLPGNFALAVNPNIDYVRIEKKDEGVGALVQFILAKSKLKIFEGQEYSIVEEFKGDKLVGQSYKPIFDYYLKTDLPNKENIWKVYAADFVTTEDGTGIVHIAPGFGEDDLRLAQEKNIPFIQHVGADGKFKKEVTEFAGQDVKPKGDHQKADIEIIKYLAGRGSLFAKEKIVHSYPHCWRCETPLLNYATSSWFIKVTDLKDRMVAENKKINWVPAQIGEARFGNWLEGAKDWGISRQRYWGTAMPIWRCQKCDKIEVLGSLADLNQKVESSNTYFLMRHGQSEHNVKDILSTRIEDNHHLTEKGREAVAKAAKKLKKKKIDVIYASPFIRTKETAAIVAESIGYPVERIIYDTRIGEVNAGVMNGKTSAEYRLFFKTPEEHFTKCPEGGETVENVRRRMIDFQLDIDARHKGQNILVISHDDPLFFMSAGGLGLTRKQILAMPTYDADFLHPGEIRELDFYRIPRNEKLELDLHRPYIDGVSWHCDCGGDSRRILDVFDTWYDSGSMPYAQNHYPFEKTAFDVKKHKSFPADFIGEGLDQTRGWFYTLLVLGVGLFNRSPYKNVVVNGLILAEDGKKMSKSLQNYPEIMPVVEKYSADALRFYMMSSPAVKAEELLFSEKGIDEVVKKVLMRLNNIYSFYALYADGTLPHDKSKNILDHWILARLAETNEKITKAFNAYMIDKAARPIDEFIEDFSVWYLRRSRDRFKGGDLPDKTAALATMRQVLLKFSILIAPFIPFTAEDIYQKVKTEKDVESVHLSKWPKFEKYDDEILSGMTVVRKNVEYALALRAKEGIKVRQPLALLKIKSDVKSQKLLEIIAEEVNVKKVVVEANLKENVELDLHLSPELIEEGKLRELCRAIQEIRKEMKFNPQDKALLEFSGDEKAVAFVKKYADELAKKVNLVGAPSFVPATSGTPVVAEDLHLFVQLKKV